MSVRPYDPGDHVLVFDSALFVDDVSTPLSITMREAVVAKCYLESKSGRTDYKSPDATEWLIDVIFVGEESSGRISKGHVASMAQALADYKWPETRTRFEQLKSASIAKLQASLWKLQPWEVIALHEALTPVVDRLKREAKRHDARRTVATFSSRKEHHSGY